MKLFLTVLSDFWSDIKLTESYVLCPSVFNSELGFRQIFLDPGNSNFGPRHQKKDIFKILLQYPLLGSDEGSGFWIPVCYFAVLRLVSLTRWDSQVLGVTFRVSGLGYRISPQRWVLSLGSGIPSRFPCLGSHFLDKPIKSSLGRHIFQSLTEALVQIK